MIGVMIVCAVVSAALTMWVASACANVIGKALAPSPGSFEVTFADRTDPFDWTTTETDLIDERDPDPEPDPDEVTDGYREPWAPPCRGCGPSRPGHEPEPEWPPGYWGHADRDRQGY